MFVPGIQRFVTAANVGGQSAARLISRVHRFVTAAPPAERTAHLVAMAPYRPDVYFGGNGFIAGKMPAAPGPGALDGRVTRQGTPTAARVTAIHRQTKITVAETWSAPDGTYQLDFLDPSQEYVVIAWDHLGEYNAVIRDRIRPKPYAE